MDSPNTILIDSRETESGEQLSGAFKKVAATEIQQFKKDYQSRFPGSDPEKIKDGELLREVMNTVGKPGKMGEQIKCVISVSMLTEGWDANTVTHILGVRAFSSQLLCEQVVGRGLRRTDYDELEPLHTNPELETFPPQFAEVFGIPFSFIPSAESSKPPRPGRIPTHVHTLDERKECKITFPCLSGYRHPFHEDKLKVDFGEDSHYEVQRVADFTTTSSILGDEHIDPLELQSKRIQEVDYEIAREILKTYFREYIYLFPQLREIVRRWREQCVTYNDGTYPQLLLLGEYKQAAAEKIHNAIQKSTAEESEIQPILHRYRPSGSTEHVAFDTALPVYRTVKKCHISHVAIHSQWEEKIARTLEGMNNVSSYVKNYHLGFTIPYLFDSKPKQYTPDFIVNIENRRNKPLNLIVEVSGKPDDSKKSEKVDTAKKLWCPAVNNAITSITELLVDSKRTKNRFHSAQWEMLEISNPSQVQTAITDYVDGVV